MAGRQPSPARRLLRASGTGLRDNQPLAFQREELCLGDAEKNYYQVVNDPHVTLMDISLRRDPGIPIMQWARGGPSVQIEIEAGPRAVSLNADEDGLYLRAVGPSIVDPSHRVIYTVSLSSVWPWIP